MATFPPRPFSVWATNFRVTIISYDYCVYRYTVSSDITRLCHLMSRFMVVIFPLYYVTGGISGLTILGFNKSRVALSWQNPNYHLFSYVYVITSKPLQSGVITHYSMETFLKDAKPHVFIDLMGHECEVVEVTVTVYGNDDIRDAINVTLPSCE